MKLTVNDIKNFPILEKLELIAGKGGLNKPVVHCGILDYEYDKDVSSKYYDYNYQMDGFLTLTSFLYAKNDPNLIYDAVKKLVAKKGSGLIVKNIFTNFNGAYFVQFVKVRSTWCWMMLFIILTHAMPRRWFDKMGEFFVKTRLWVKFVIFVIVVQLVIEFMSADVAPFIYFQF